MQTTASSIAGYCAITFFLVASPGIAQTLAHWDFNAGAVDNAISVLPVNDLSGNSNLLVGFNEQTSPVYSADTAKGTGLSCRVVNQDTYTLSPTLNNWSPLQWTIEISVKLDRLEGWNTIIGRDGSSRPGNVKSDFYFQKNGVNDAFRLDFATTDGDRYQIDSSLIPVAGKWYDIALVSDGVTVAMYINNGGAGYQLSASTALSRKPGANNALAAGGFNWTFGRGWFDGKFVDNIVGNLDDIRFTEGALPPERFLHATDASLSRDKLEIGRNGRDVVLALKLAPGVLRQIEVYRSDTSDPAGRTLLASVPVKETMYFDTLPSKDKIYWYWLVVTRADGHVDTTGPVRSKASEVWMP